MRGSRRTLFWCVIVLLDLSAVALGWWGWRHFRGRKDGLELNIEAWESSYRERGLVPPPSGPREGYMGSRLSDHTIATPYGPTAVDVSLEGLVHLDHDGFQRLPSPSPDAAHVLIIGGSVAFGAYASSEEKTYIALLSRWLGSRGSPTAFTVLAQGGWTSAEEVKALAFALEKESNFDVVLILDGLNDLANTPRLPWPEKARRYLENMEQARRLTSARGIPCVFSLQPFLPAKKQKTDEEEFILELYRTDQQIIDNYALLRAGLSRIADSRTSHFIDCSTALNDEKPTTFSDLWHFSDFGHELLAGCLAGPLQSLLVSIRRSPGKSP